MLVAEARLEAVLQAAGSSTAEVRRVLDARGRFIAAYGHSPRSRREVRVFIAREGGPALGRALELARLAEREAIGRSVDVLVEAQEATAAWLERRPTWVRGLQVLLPTALTIGLCILAAWSSSFRRSFFPVAADEPGASSVDPPRSAPEAPHAALLAEADQLWRGLQAAAPWPANAPPDSVEALLDRARMPAGAVSRLRGWTLDVDRLRAAASAGGRPSVIVLRGETAAAGRLLLWSGGSRLLRDGRAWWR